MSHTLHDLIALVYDVLNDVDPLSAEEQCDYEYETAHIMPFVHLIVMGKEITAKDEAFLCDRIREIFNVMNEEFVGPMPTEVIQDLTDVLLEQIHAYRETLEEHACEHCAPEGAIINENVNDAAINTFVSPTDKKVWN